MRETRLSHLIAQLEFEIEALKLNPDEISAKKWRLKRAELAKFQYQLFEKLEKERPFIAVQLLWNSAQTHFTRAFARIFKTKSTGTEMLSVESLESLNEHALFVKGLQALSGVGMECNYHLAFQCFEASAKKADHAASQYFLGWMYINDLSITQNPGFSLHWYGLSAQQGNDFAQNDLGFLYYKFGRTVPQDYGLALYWFNLSAHQGNVLGQYHLASLYEDGHGVQRSIDQAIYWYLLSAEQGNPVAQFRLASIYLNGTGVPINNILAVYWCRLSARQEYRDAKERLDWMYYNQKVRIHSDDIIEYRRDSQLGLEGASFPLGKLANEGHFYARYHYVMGLPEEKIEVKLKLLNEYPNDFFESLMLDPFLNEMGRMDWLEKLLAASQEQSRRTKLNEENLASCKKEIAIFHYGLLAQKAQKYNTNEDQIKIGVEVVNIQETREIVDRLLSLLASIPKWHPGYAETQLILAHLHFMLDKNASIWEQHMEACIKADRERKWINLDELPFQALLYSLNILKRYQALSLKANSEAMKSELSLAEKNCISRNRYALIPRLRLSLMTEKREERLHHLRFVKITDEDLSETQKCLNAWEYMEAISAEDHQKLIEDIKKLSVPSLL